MDYDSIDFDLLLIKLNNLMYHMKKYLDAIRHKGRKVDYQRLRVETKEFAKAASSYTKRSMKEQVKNV